MCDKYNGWRNYETWVINLWITNDTDSDYMIDLLMEGFDGSDSDVYELSKRLRDHIEEFNPLGDEASMYSDLLNAAISTADYYEIAKNWGDDYMQNHPIKGTKDNPAEYELEPGFPSVDSDWWVMSDSLNRDIGDFWNAFNACVQDAIDNNYKSIVIEYNVTESDVTRWNQWKADRLIAKQSTRSSEIKGE